ncbi:gliding motility-associated C-terminal domain-containing protein [Prolixibacteraceae bacterium Z1-6]|uniref:Gliding motility-associated C-terminal domain-containing protein n=1 Tax=Draconibacterium aestuarii TaxID=2998507 RepID=A0A9X3F3W5_9BACT|nr:gliding motility-associated C-terminal domain-containing protein [Prolixibacteraceae bacterium Z1-6]
MFNTKPAFLLILIFLMGNAGLVFSQNEIPSIENPNSATLVYCSDSVLVAPDISIRNIQVDEEGEGMKISIANYESGQDILVYDPEESLSYYWNNSKGTLEISGKGTDAEYEEAVSKVYYKNLSSQRKVGIRSFSISLLDADYLPRTKHFYRFVKKRGIRWTEARNACETMNYYGLQGYLATITSAEENEFIWSKIDGVGWIGASDAKTQGKWIWETGPEAGTQFFQGTSASGSTISGQYSNWNYGEPNNLQKSWGDYENYAHMVVAPDSKPKSWNDLSDEGDKNSPDGYYYPQGYIVEFGGMPDEPDLKLSATVKIEVMDTKHPELDYTETQTLFCGIKTSQVSFVFKGETPQVEFIPIDDRVVVADAQTSQPTVTVPEFGFYKFQLITIDQANCDYSDTIQLEFHNQPEAIFNLDENDCYGYNLKLAFEGNTVEEAYFSWFFNEKEYLSGIDLDSVQIPLGFEDIDRTVGLTINEQGCSDSLTKPVKVKPNIILSAENTSGCSPITVNFSATTNKPAQAFEWDFGDNRNSEEQNPSHTFLNSNDDIIAFDISLTAYSVDGCDNTATYKDWVQVYPVPIAGFNADSYEVLITDPVVTFTNTSHAATSYNWDFGDSASISHEINPFHRYVSMSLYDIVLEAQNELNCADTIVKQVAVTFDKLFPPNAFSPNATAEDDRVFRIYSEGVLDDGYQLLIFNRWGEVIFESNSQNVGWDGRMKNANFAPAGVYTWVLQYTDFTGKTHKQQGTVTLVI